ncbi:hypothetical protein D3C86_1206160 [compost metagenome]
MSIIIDDIEHILWEKITVSFPLLCNLMDTVWYNLEHVVGGGNTKGLDDLRFLGSKYPTLMYTANNDMYVDPEKIQYLLKELEDISNKWSNEWTFVQLFTKSQEGWNGGSDNPSPVVIYDPNAGESPSRLGYKHNGNSGLLDLNGNQLASSQHETVLCSIETKLGTYDREPLIKALLGKLIETCKKAIKSNKGIAFDYESYNYLN